MAMPDTPERQTRGPGGTVAGALVCVAATSVILGLVTLGTLGLVETIASAVALNVGIFVSLHALRRATRESRARGSGDDG